MASKDINVHISSGSIVTGLLFVLLLGLLWFLRDIVLVVLTAIVIASAMEPGIHAFMRWGLRRVLSVIVMYATVIGIIGGVLFFFVPPILNDAASFLQHLPATLSSLNIAEITHGFLPGSVTETLSSAEVLRSLSTTLADSTGGIFSTVSAFFGGLTSFVLIVVFSFYFCVQETGVDDFLRVITPVDEQAYVLHLWKRSQDKIGKWMQGQLVLALIVGVLLYLGLLILAVPNALVLAVLAAVFELIPVFGQFLAAIPAVAVAAADGGVTAAFLVVGLYVIVQQFEAHLIYPVVVKKVVGVPPLLVILSLIIGFKLVGFLGVLLSVPIAGAIQEFVSDVDREKTRALARAGMTPEGEPA
ncbi:MAG: AI-2E family transporter [Patescibacteria group bacterium]|nr:AI-2E family transporter [Patescibacteria group bacterium]